ncbi:MAG: phycobilisome rod-core linker polypeptide [Cyanobacteria bacterium P01_E01_bin.45]
MTSLMSARQLGVEPIVSSAEVRVSDRSDESLQETLRAAYRQVFGNAYLMDSERLAIAESRLRQGDLSVRDFIRELGVSEAYRKRFFYPCSQVRFIELNFKHFLGRAPYDRSELSEHIQLYSQLGYEAEIDSYVYSQEYFDNFGDSIIPTYRELDGARSLRSVAFSRILHLYKGNASSDRAQYTGNRSRLISELAGNTASSVSNSSFGKRLVGTGVGKRSQLFRLRVTRKPPMVGCQIRSTVREYVVPFEQLSDTLRRLGNQGNRITDIIPA